MERIICPRCSKGIVIHPEGVVWVSLRSAVIDWQEKGCRVIADYYCAQCQHLLTTSYKLVYKEIKLE